MIKISNKKEIKVCLFCGISFHDYLKRERKYCSKSCLMKATGSQRTKKMWELEKFKSRNRHFLEVKICPICKNEFITNRENIYCSRKCGSKSSNHSKGNPGWSKDLTKEIDKRVAKAAISRIGQLPWNYGLTKEDIPEFFEKAGFQKGHPVYYRKYNLITKQCVYCGEDFIVNENSSKRFCSRFCSNKFKVGKFFIIKNKRKTPTWNKNKTYLEDSRILANDKHWNWRDGSSKEPYDAMFNSEIKDWIKNRDNFICQLCHSLKNLRVHHIDYDKKRSSPGNLITLCSKCNSKVNQNRIYWQECFYSYLENLGKLRHTELKFIGVGIC